MEERIRIINEISEKLSLDKLETVKKQMELKFEKNKNLKSDLNKQNKMIKDKIKSISDKLKKVNVNNKVIEALSRLKGFFNDYKVNSNNLYKSINEIKNEFNSMIEEDKNFVLLGETLECKMIENGLIEKQKKFFFNLNLLTKKIKHDCYDLENLIEKFKKDEKN